MKKVVSEISGIVFSIPWLMAKDHGLFEAEGIDMAFVRAQGDRANRVTADPNEVNPILGHVPYEDSRVSIYRAWEEGQVRRAYESKRENTKVISLRAAVMSQAILVRPDSPHNYPGTLGHKPVAVSFHAAAHYVALRLLDGYLPPEKIKLVSFGSPQRRFEAMMNGDADACVVMEPWITLGEKIGCKSLAEGHYLGAENASDDMDAETFAAINRAVGKAIDMFNADKRKYLHYMIDNPGFAEVAAKYGGVTPEDFHLPRLRYTKETYYAEELVEDTYNWMVRWGLLSETARTDDLVDNRVAVPTPADA